MALVYPCEYSRRYFECYVHINRQGEQTYSEAVDVAYEQAVVCGDRLLSHARKSAKHGGAS